MTTPSGRVDGGTAAMTRVIQPIAEVFTSSAQALWATTYNLELAMVNEFLLPRLGEPPVNLTVLADHRRLSASLDRIPPERADSLALVNRRWLLRGIRPCAQVFHPKSLLAVTARRATLLVGSGNLSRYGLDEGREVFTTFASSTPVGNAAITTWMAWMRRLVAEHDDTTLAGRFRDLEGRLPELNPPSAGVPTPLLHNLDVPIATQLIDTVGAAGVGVDELLLMAPFYDQEAAAVGLLLDQLRPARVVLHVAKSTSVDGARLAERLQGSGARVDVLSFEPDRFVHAKLIGIVAGLQAWLLSGSANLSRAALTLTSTHGNVELAVLAPLNPDAVRAAFRPPGVEVVHGRGLEDLVSLTFEPDAEATDPPVQLRSATALPDGCIEVIANKPVAPGWMLDDLTSRRPLRLGSAGRAVTDGPLPGRLVRVLDAEGQVLSNRVMVDDPASLGAALRAGTAPTDSGRPAELGREDAGSELYDAIVWLHQHLVMDVSERVAGRPVGGVGPSEAGAQDEDDLWERLEREDLARDPRAATYQRMWGHDLPGTNEPIIELLETLRSRAPSPEPVPVVATGTTPAPEPVSVLEWLLVRSAEGGGDADKGGSEDAEDAAKPERPARPWSVATRIRVRTRSVLRRWAAAQADPRLVWVDPLAPVGNLEAVATVLARLHLAAARDPETVELTQEDLEGLWQDWLTPFVGMGQGDGWLDRLDDTSRTRVRERTSTDLRDITTALCWLIVRPRGNQREHVVALQPVLNAALQQGLVEPTEATAHYLSAVVGRSVSAAEVDEDLLRAVEFLDDPLWCSRTARQLGLDTLQLEVASSAARTGVRVRVSGIEDPLLDARLPRLVAAARRYRRASMLAVFAADASWRLVCTEGANITYLANRREEPIESTTAFSGPLLESITGRDGVLADLFPLTRACPQAV